MKEAIKNFNVGELVALSTGEYSDYCVNGLFVVLKNFDAQVLLDDWAKETGRELVNGTVRADYSNQQVDFIGWLNNGGYVKDVEYRELHTGNYGKTELSEEVTPC